MAIRRILLMLTPIIVLQHFAALAALAALLSCSEKTVQSSLRIHTACGELVDDSVASAGSDRGWQSATIRNWPICWADCPGASLPNIHLIACPVPYPSTWKAMRQKKVRELWDVWDHETLWNNVGCCLWLCCWLWEKLWLETCCWNSCAQMTLTSLGLSPYYIL